MKRDKHTKEVNKIEKGKVYLRKKEYLVYSMKYEQNKLVYSTQDIMLLPINTLDHKAEPLYVGESAHLYHHNNNVGMTFVLIYTP